MKNILRKVYLLNEVYSEDFYNEIRQYIFYDATWVGLHTLDSLQNWFYDWDKICHGSIDELDSCESVHICEHGTLYLKRGENYQKNFFGSGHDNCTEYRENFPI